MYRPDNWENPNESRNVALAGAYESGADAILEGLKGDEKNAYYCQKGLTDHVIYWPGGMEIRLTKVSRAGHFVFIPEEK